MDCHAMDEVTERRVAWERDGCREGGGCLQCLPSTSLPLHFRKHPSAVYIMLAKRVRRLLQDESRRQNPLHRQRHGGSGRDREGGVGHRLSRVFTFISGKRMTPRGCECLVSLAEVSRGGPPSASRPATSTAVLRGRRAVLPGVAPGELLRTRPTFYDSLTALDGGAATLPRHCHTLRLERREGRRPGASSAFLVVAPRRPLPCAAASCGSQCQLCPWMAVGAEMSGSIKGEAVREAVDAALREAAATVVPKHLDPFTVAVQTHYLQEAELTFVREREAGLDDDGVGGRSSREPTGSQGHFELVTTLPGASPGTSAKTTSQKRPTRRLDQRATAAAARQRRTSRSGQRVLDQCPLATLEQKRLGPSLDRWAARLPTAMRNAIGSAYISQFTLPRGPCVKGRQSRNEADGDGEEEEEERKRRPWESSLLVTLTMHKDVEAWGPQSPLCGPSHPADVLAVEEQRLVDAVLAAAPLVQSIAVHVLFTPKPGCEHPFSDGDVGLLDCLYPVTVRRVAAADILKARHRRLRQFGPPREVVCYCPSLEGGEERRAYLPGLHSSVLWQGLILSSLSSGRGSPPAPTPAPPLASFWRHRGAVDAAVSLLFSLLLSSASGAVRVVPPTLCALSTNPDTGPASMLLALAMSRMAESLAPMVSEATEGEGEAATPSPTPSSSSCDGAGSEEMSLAAVLNDAESDVAALLHRLSPLFSGRGRRRARVLLVQCSTDTKASLVQHALAAVIGYCESENHTSAIALEAGVVDVDSLSAAFVGYAFLELQRST